MLDIVVALLFGVFAFMVFIGFMRHAPVDKKKHLIVSTIGVVVIALVANFFLGIEAGMNVAFFVMFIAGFLKEIYDKYGKGKFFSLGDLSYNFVGIMFGLLFTATIWKLVIFRL